MAMVKELRDSLIKGKHMFGLNIEPALTCLARFKLQPKEKYLIFGRFGIAV